MKLILLPVALLAWATLLPLRSLQAADWLQWRGPNRDGHCTETGLLKEWPKGGPPLAWKAQGLGKGFASVAVSEGRIFTSGDGAEHSSVHALDLKGTKLWSAKLGRVGERGGYQGTRGTPTVSGNMVVTLGQFGDLVCLDAKTGEEKWRTHLQKDLSGDVGGWGYSESPVVEDGRVVCIPGGSKGTVAALDEKTGKVLWRSTGLTDRAEYTSLIPSTIGGVRQYIVLTDRTVGGVAVDDGRLLWNAARRGSTAVIPTPIEKEGSVYVTSGYGVGCNLFKVQSGSGGFQAEEVYNNKVMVNHHGGVILLGENLYGYSDGKGWTSQEFSTGKMRWSEKNLGKGSILYADGQFYLRSEGGPGTLALIEATPEGYREKGRFDQPDRSDQNSWPHPVISGGTLFIRDQDLLLAYNVRAAK